MASVQDSVVIHLPEVKVEPFNDVSGTANNELNVGEITAEENASRFAESSEEDIQRLLEEKNSENTKRATKTAVKILRDYMTEKGYDPRFESLDKRALNNVLRKFYVEARKKNGDLYKKSALSCIRFGINRHLQYRRNVDILNDPEFVDANEVFKAQIVELKRLGKGEVDHSTDITPADLQKLYSSGVLNTSTPEGLQKKAFFDVIMYLPGKRNREKLREQTRDSYIVAQDTVTGLKYIHQKQENVSANLTKMSARMYERKGNPRCPVASFLKYLSKLNPINPWLWQRPKRHVHASEDDAVWYENSALGHNTLGELMAGISKAAGLSRIYTYNCIKGTYASVLDELPVSPSVSVVTPKLRQILPRGCSTSAQSLPTMVTISGAVSSGLTENQAPSRVAVVSMTTSPAVQHKASTTSNTMPGSPLTTHVLDTTLGAPARNLKIQLFMEEIRPDCRMWKQIAAGYDLLLKATNADGRVADLVTPAQFLVGKYMMRFETEDYFKSIGVTSYFYPYVEIVFIIKDPKQHYHVPLLLSPFSYSTYRGS